MSFISVGVVFDVPDGIDFKGAIPSFIEGTKKGTKESVFYGFASCGNKVICREAYKTANGLLAHMKEMKETLDKIMGQVGKEKIRVSVMGPQAELDKVKPALASLQCRYVTLDSNALSIAPFPSGTEDKHITIIPAFKVGADKLDQFKAGYSKFYEATKKGSGANGIYYYGFGDDGETVVCREGFKDADSALAHGADVKDLMKEPVEAIGGPENITINVVGPKAEIDKLRPKLEPRGAVFWELEAGAFWM